MSLFGNSNGAGRHEVHEIHPEPIDLDFRPVRHPVAPPAPKPVKLNTLDEIARLLRTAEYGEMMDLAVALEKMRETEGADNIAKILHEWAKSR